MYTTFKTLLTLLNSFDEHPAENYLFSKNPACAVSVHNLKHNTLSENGNFLMKFRISFKIALPLVCHGSLHNHSHEVLLSINIFTPSQTRD